jgi:hypothetical protein
VSRTATDSLFDSLSGAVCGTPWRSVAQTRQTGEYVRHLTASSVCRNAGGARPLPPDARTGWPDHVMDPPASGVAQEKTSRTAEVLLAAVTSQARYLGVKHHVCVRIPSKRPAREVKETASEVELPVSRGVVDPNG